MFEPYHLIKEYTGEEILNNNACRLQAKTEVTYFRINLHVIKQGAQVQELKGSILAI